METETPERSAQAIRSAAAIRQARHRDRAKQGKSIWGVALSDDLVACALIALGKAAIVDLTDRRACERVLGEVMESYFYLVTRDCPDDEVRAVLAELRRNLKARLA